MSFSSSSSIFCALLPLFLHSFLFLIVFCCGGLFLERIPASSHFRTFFGGKTSLSHTHSSLQNKTRVLVLFLFAQYFVVTRHIISVRVFLWLRLVSLCLWLCSVEVCKPTFPLNLSQQVFFSLLVEPSLVFIFFFPSLVGEVLHAPWN